VIARYHRSRQRNLFRSRFVIRQVVSIAVLLAATVAIAEPKVSGGVTEGNPRGSTPPASDPSVQEKAAAEQSRRDAAKRALDALKGSPKDKADKRDDRRPGDR
jgi:hypothetical protein